jgi:hypothetical protein
MEPTERPKLVRMWSTGNVTPALEGDEEGDSGKRPGSSGFYTVARERTED